MNSAIAVGDTVITHRGKGGTIVKIGVVTKVGEPTLLDGTVYVVRCDGILVTWTRREILAWVPSRKEGV